MKCEDCKWWDDSENEVDCDLRYGKCKRHAPCIVLGMAVSRDLDDALLAEFPRTESELDWCGEFEDKKQVSLNDITIDILGLGRRASNCLRSANIGTIEQLKKANDCALLCRRNLGEATLYEIKQKLADFEAEEK